MNLITTAALTTTIAAPFMSYARVNGELVGTLVTEDQTTHYGTQYIFDNGTDRAVVRPGDRSSYTAEGFYFEIETLAGKPGQVFATLNEALGELVAFAANRV